jgi:hypothetical protein
VVSCILHDGNLISHTFAATKPRGRFLRHFRVQLQVADVQKVPHGGPARGIIC